MTTRHAFCRIETIDDVDDAVRLLLAGYDLAIEPVPGSLRGFDKPWRIKTGGDVISSDIAGLSSGIAGLLRLRGTGAESFDFELDLTQLSERQRSAFEGVIGLLNRRALQLLSACDIADMFEWIAQLTDARVDIQLPYGHASYPWLLRRDGTDVADNEVWRPQTSNVTRSVVCYTKPDRADLDLFLSLAAHTGRTIGIINGKACRSRLEAFRGMSPDKSLLLPNHGSVTVSAVDLGDLVDKDRWTTIAGISREHLRDLDTLPPGLQNVWEDQRQAHRLFALSFDRGTQDDRNHAEYGAILEAQKLRVAPPKIVTCNHLDEPDLKPIDALNMYQRRLAFAGHNCGATITFDVLDGPSIADYLSATWDGFVGANFKSRSCR